MKDKRQEMVERVPYEEKPKTAIDLWRHAHVKKNMTEQRPTDSMLAVYRDKFTYTFIMDDEVVSVHFDGRRREIFIKGHNIMHLQLSPSEKKALNDLKGVLLADKRGRKLYSSYLATLGRCSTDNI